MQDKQLDELVLAGEISSYLIEDIHDGVNERVTIVLLSGKSIVLSSRGYCDDSSISIEVFNKG